MEQTSSSAQPALAGRPVSAPPRRGGRPGARLAWIGQGFLLALAAVVVYILATNLIKDPPLFAQFVLSGLQLGFVYALIALGYTMVYGLSLIHI